MAVTFHTFPVWPFNANCTIITDEKAQRAVVVDPGGDAQNILAYLEDNHLQLDSVWLTHAHYDHLSGLNDFPPQGSVPLFLHENDWPLFKNINQQAAVFHLPELDIKWQLTRPPVSYTVAGGSLTIQVIQTPGHAPGGISLYLQNENTIITGDVLFAAGGRGRTDFIGGNLEQLKKSILRLMELDPSCRIITGHGEFSTILQERPYHQYY